MDSAGFTWWNKRFGQHSTRSKWDHRFIVQHPPGCGCGIFVIAMASSDHHAIRLAFGNKLMGRQNEPWWLHDN